MRLNLRAAKLLKSQRKKLKLGQVELSHKLKVSQQFIANMEAGTSKVPSYMIEPLSEALGIDKELLIKKMVLDYKNFLLEGYKDEYE